MIENEPQHSPEDGPAAVQSEQRVLDGGEEKSLPGTDSPEYRKIVSFLKKTRFKPCLFGGVDEADVWKKLEKLTGLFEAALQAERIRYNVLLEERLSKNEREQVEAEGDQ